MSQALYRKYRSKSLDEVLGQDHITNILKNALDKGKIAHAYLLTGPRGTGKTSVARILAHQINHLPYDEVASHLDIIEIDAASNNGVEDIRSLREKARVAPAAAAKKVYIIDEVHMLSKPAFNALLKTLEEPPAHVIFILATTDADKLPATILSRVQQFYFRPIPKSVIARQLINIAKSEGFLLDEAAAELIAERSNGGFRDAISLLDQLSVVASKTDSLSSDHVAAHLGLTGQQAIERLIQAYHYKDFATSLDILKSLESDGVDPLIISNQLLSTLRQQLADNSENIRLIHQLIEVNRHPHPDLKLLTIFLNQPTETIQSVVAKKTAAKPAKSVPAVAKQPETAMKTAVKTSEPEEPKKPEPKAKKDQPKPAAKPKVATNAKLDWQALLDKSSSASAGLHSLLSKCGYSQDQNQLTIYAGNKFAAKKLDDIKFRSILNSIVEDFVADSEIIIRAGKKPPSDEKLAAVSAIMGGGEEIKLEGVM